MAHKKYHHSKHHAHHSDHHPVKKHHVRHHHSDGERMHGQHFGSAELNEHSDRNVRSMSGGEYYSSYDSKKRMEMRDGEMIHEDHAAIANFPQHPIMREYPRHANYLDGYLDDTIAGIDFQQGRDNGQMHRHMKPRKA